ncbi:MAG: hypothetical protein QOF08_2995, partial [Gaiellales bacterium]|nr:hypothetical protein [Gaiellales bacterium]
MENDQPDLQLTESGDTDLELGHPPPETRGHQPPATTASASTAQVPPKPADS